MLYPTFLTRPATHVDAHHIVQLLSVLYSETEYLPHAPGDVIASPQQLAVRIEAGNRTGGAPVFVAEVKGELVGVVFGSRGMTARTRHIMHVVIGVLQAHCGLGIGHALMRDLETSAAMHHLHRLELAVHSDNQRAIALYKHLGYVIEGKKLQSVCIRDKYVDELILSKLLNITETAVSVSERTHAAITQMRASRQKKTA
ncbi:MAG: GNAT family N-acetyltransferase [Pseudomonadota bacterium]